MSKPTSLHLNLHREFFAQIAAGTKRIKYRSRTPYWRRRVEELLRWCDTLEAQLHQTRTLGAHLLASALHQILTA